MTDIGASGDLNDHNNNLFSQIKGNDLSMIKTN